MGSWETWCFVTFVVLVLCSGLNFPNNAFYLFLCLVFSVLCKGMNKRNNLSLGQFVFRCLSCVSVFKKKTTVFFEPNKLGLFTSV